MSKVIPMRGRLRWSPPSRFYRRQVRIGDGFNLEDVLSVESDLAKMAGEGKEPVVIRINSKHGSLYAARRLRHVIGEHRSELRIVCGLVTRYCYSTSLWALQACSPRLAYPSAKFRFDDLRRYFVLSVGPDDDPVQFGPLAEGVAATHIVGVTEVRTRIASDLASAMRGLSVAEVVAMMRQGATLDAEEALALGVIDGIYDPSTRRPNQ